MKVWKSNIRKLRKIIRLSVMKLGTKWGKIRYIWKKLRDWNRDKGC